VCVFALERYKRQAVALFLSQFFYGLGGICFSYLADFSDFYITPIFVFQLRRLFAFLFEGGAPGFTYPFRVCTCSFFKGPPVAV
jgi:hypothetical protein